MPKLSTAVKALQKEGFLSSLTPKSLKALILDSYDASISEIEEEEDISSLALSVLTGYYAERVEEGFKAGFIEHDWRFGQETDDVIAEFSAMVGAPPMFVQTGMGPDILYLRRDDGYELELRLDQGLESVADFYNEALKARGDKREFYSLDTQGDSFVYLLLTKQQVTSLSKAYALAGFSAPSKPAPDPAKIVKDFLKVEPTTCEGYFYRATNLEKWNEPDLALSDLRKATDKERRPAVLVEFKDKLTLLKAYKSLTRLLFAKGEFLECIAACSEAIDLATDKDSIFMVGREVRLLRGRASIELQDATSAIKDFDHLIAYNKYDADAYFHRSRAYELQSDRRNADRDSAQAKQLGYQPPRH